MRAIDGILARRAEEPFKSGGPWRAETQPATDSTEFSKQCLALYTDASDKLCGTSTVWA